MATPDLETILRRISQINPVFDTNTSPPTGSGLTGLNPSGGTSPLPSNLQTGYTNRSLNLDGGVGGNTFPNYSSVDDFGFDAFYETELGNLQRRLADARSQFDLANQQDVEEYERAVRDTERQQELEAASLLDRLANQGILRSGIQVKAQSDLGESYQRRLADLERRKTEGQTGRQTEFSNYQRDVNDQIAMLQQEHTRREAERQAELARRQAEQDPAGQFRLPPGMSPDDFRNAPPGSELANNYGLILNNPEPVPRQGPVGEGEPPPYPGAGDAYATWDPQLNSNSPIEMLRREFARRQSEQDPAGQFRLPGNIPGGSDPISLSNKIPGKYARDRYGRIVPYG